MSGARTHNEFLERIRASRREKVIALTENQRMLKEFLSARRCTAPKCDTLSAFWSIGNLPETLYCLRHWRKLTPTQQSRFNRINSEHSPLNLSNYKKLTLRQVIELVGWEATLLTQEDREFNRTFPNRHKVTTPRGVTMVMTAKETWSQLRLEGLTTYD